MSVLSFIVPSSSAVHDEVHAICGGALCASGELVHAIAAHAPELALSSEGFTVLLSEQLVSSLCDEELDAVLAHEMGHAYLGHLSVPAEQRTGDVMLRNEIEADAVAARVVGAAAMYSALCFVAADYLDNPQIAARLDALSALL